MNLEKVIFDNIDSYEDLGLILKSFEDKLPEQKRSSIEVPGRNGILDTTYALTSEPLFNNRTLTLTFGLYRELIGDWKQLIDSISNALHGKEMSIYPSWKQGYHLTGNVSVDGYSIETTGELTIVCDCEPYYYANIETTEMVELTGSQMMVTLTNDRKWLLPVITTTGNGIKTVYVNNEETEIDGAVNNVQYDTILLKDGNNSVTLSGSGTITFTYRKGRL